MKIQRGIVKYKQRDDIECMYCITDDNRQYYFLDPTDEKKFLNGNRIVSTALVEAIDPMVKASHIGVIDAEGKEVIPCVNKSIRQVDDNIIIVEVAEPVSQCVIDAIGMRGDPLSATKLVSTTADVKDRLNTSMGAGGRFLFNDLFSEAALYDIDGKPIVDGYYSFIGIADRKLYLSKNNMDSEMVEYSIIPPEVQNDSVVADGKNEIDVTSVEVPTEVVENALNSYNGEVSNDGLVNEELEQEVAIPTVSEDVEEQAVVPEEENIPSEQSNIFESTPSLGEATSSVEMESENMVESSDQQSNLSEESQVVAESSDNQSLNLGENQDVSVVSAEENAVEGEEETDTVTDRLIAAMEAGYIPGFEESNSFGQEEVTSNNTEAVPVPEESSEPLPDVMANNGEEEVALNEAFFGDLEETPTDSEESNYDMDYQDDVFSSKFTPDTFSDYDDYDEFDDDYVTETSTAESYGVSEAADTLRAFIGQVRNDKMQLREYERRIQQYERQIRDYDRQVNSFDSYKREMDAKLALQQQKMNALSGKIHKNEAVIMRYEDKIHDQEEN